MTDRVAVELRRFGPIGLLAVAAVLAGSLLGAPVGALLVLAWVLLSGTPWEALGLNRPRSWPMILAVGVPFGVALKLLLKAVGMPLLGAPDLNPRYHYLADNPSALPGILLAVILAGFAEEILFRGFLFERLHTLLGRGTAATLAILLVTSALFALAHVHDQGLAGAQQAAVTGAVFGALYVKSRRLWLPIAVHLAFDLTAVALIYFNWEAPVAHWVFRA